MDIPVGALKQGRITKMAKGVCASAKVIDEKFRAKYGEPHVALHENGSYKRHRKTGLPYYLNSSPYRCALITLTYRDGAQWEESQIRDVLRHYRMWFKRNGKGESFHYVWVMELTEKDRPHYHIVAWFPKGVVPPLPDKQGWWLHGMSNAQFAVSPVGYIAKYASKGKGKSGEHLPKGGRLWGYGGLLMAERAHVAYALAPSWLKSLFHDMDSYPVKRVYERVVNEIRYACGFLHQQVIRKSGWLIQHGIAAGTWFFGPYEFVGMTEKGGIALSHRGVVEMVSSEGESFFIPHKA